MLQREKIGGTAIPPSEGSAAPADSVSPVRWEVGLGGSSSFPERQPPWPSPAPSAWESTWTSITVMTGVKMKPSMLAAVSVLP